MQDPKTPETTYKDLGLDSFHQPKVDSGLSLSDLNAAFAQMLSSGHDPYVVPEVDGLTATAVEPNAETGFADDSKQPADAIDDEACALTPRSILEAMLFVGSADSQPLASDRVAGLMRGVRAAEIEELVRELNEQYAALGRPYEIKGEGVGFRMALRDGFERIRDKLHGRVRHARLSPAAVEVLSIIAYNGPQTHDEIARLRGTPSGAILSQLVRRQLLSVDRPESSPRSVRYCTTQRFLDLFSLQSLEDLPRSEDLDRR
jgi:segregation and condensation protein B